MARVRPDVVARPVTTLAGTVLPLVLVYGAVLVLLVASRRPPPVRPRVRGPVLNVLSIGVGGYAMFASAMAVYCSAQRDGAVTCLTSAGAEAGVVAATVIAAALAGVMLTGRTPRDGTQR